MRFILFSDVHLHLWKNISVSRQWSALAEMLTYAYENNIKTLLFCGDMFHTHGSIKTEIVQLFNMFLTELKRNNIALIGIPGNHDYGDKYGVVNALNAINLIDGELLYGVRNCSRNSLPIYGIPYKENYDDLAYGLALVPEDCILLLHQGVSGIEINSKGFTLNEILKPSMIPDRIIHAFSGHYHTYHRFASKGTIPGALIQHGWNDASEERGFLDVKIDTSKNVHVQKIPCYNGKNFKIIDYNSQYKSMITEACPNIKVINCPDEKETQTIRSLGMIAEVKYEETGIPQDIKDNNFSSIELFNEYIKARNLSDKYIDVGKKIITS